MKKKKRQIKKIPCIIAAVVLIILSILIYKLIADILYKRTYDYKLLQKGYKEEEIVYLKENAEDKLEDILNIDYEEYIIPILKEKYFLWKNFKTYLEYIKEYPEKKYEEIIQEVNIGTNKAFYTDAKETDLTKEYALLVNKYHFLSSDYEPEDLVRANGQYTFSNNQYMRQEVYSAFTDMFFAAKEEGLTLLINSSYRNYENQQKAYKDYEDAGGKSYADRYAARPGFSEHQTGLSLDIFTPEFPTTSTFHLSKEYTWLLANAHKYGFILRYPEGKEKITGFSYESWHYRYLGVELATKVYESGLTYDEYYAYYLDK